MMIHMTTVGGVTADIEGKESANGASIFLLISQ